jgi:hypothetical protein
MLASCQQFDFTLTFEQSVFGVAVSSVFLLLLPYRLRHLYGANIKTVENNIFTLKYVSKKELKKGHD